MSIRPSNITFDCDDPQSVAKFWSDALESPIGGDGNEFMAAIHHEASGLNFLFLKVPEGKTAKNRLHIDFESVDPAAEVERLTQLGASKVAAKAEWGHEWTVMHDLEGNEFCVSGPHHSH